MEKLDMLLIASALQPYRFVIKDVKNPNKDCMFYSEDHDMGKTIPYCNRYGTFCPDEKCDIC